MTTSAAPGWVDQTFRWGQVNFNEADPEGLDVDWWTDFWKRCRIQAVTLNAGGALAYYPTEVPFHVRSPWLGDRDLFGETVAAAKGLGLRVLGRLDPSYAHQQLYDAHPDWCVTGADGRPLPATSSREPGSDASGASERFYLTCHNSPYYREFLPAVMTEVVERYDVDGFFTNAFPLAQLTSSSARSACHCPHCEAGWSARSSGAPMPAVADPADPLWRTYTDFVQESVEDTQRLLREHVKGLNPDGIFLPVTFPGPANTLRWRRWIDLVDMVGSDNQRRRTLGATNRGQPALWEAGQNGEFLRAVAAGKPVLRFCATYTHPPMMRHSAGAPLETRMIMAEGLAHGERLKWHAVGGTQHDRRWMDAVAELDVWLAEHDLYLHNTDSLAEVAILWSPRSVQLAGWRGEGAGPSPADALAGWYLALLEARLPVEYLNEEHLDQLERYRVLIVPSGTCLPAAGVEAVSRFRQRGGAVVAACGALTRDEWGGPHPPEVVSGAIGVRLSASLVGPHSHSYLAVGPADGEAPLLEGILDTDVVAGARWLSRLEADDSVTTAGSWIPDSPTMPTHRARLPSPNSDVSVLAWRDDAPPMVYLAMDFDAAFAEHQLPDHGRLLVNAVHVALAGRPPLVSVSGSGLLDVRPWRQAQSMTVYLVNLDTPALYGGPVGALSPVGPQDVRVRVDGAASVRGVRLLRDDAAAEWTQADDGTVVTTVPAVRDFEVVAVDLAAP